MKFTHVIKYKTPRVWQTVRPKLALVIIIIIITIIILSYIYFFLFSCPIRLQTYFFRSGQHILCIYGVRKSESF